MKSPTHCPKCGDSLLNTYNTSIDDRYSFWTMTCRKRLDHQFYCSTKGSSQDELITIEITLRTSPVTWIIWDFLGRHISIAKENEITRHTDIPFFEPDLSNYPKLIQKIKTYVIFD